jgi:hypothetical protein
MAAENILQTLQKIATLVERVDILAAEVRDLRSSSAARLDKVEDQSSALRERVTRLEALRDADRAEMRADLATFKIEVERAELRLRRTLPPSSSEGTGEG